MPQMLKAGITGGIGSGKTTVCQVFELLGIPVFYADDAAKILMDEAPALITAIKELLGNEVYDGKGLDRKKVGELVFQNPEKLARLNALVHPVAISFANEWMAKQQAPYVLKEAAIFFETGSQKAMDVMIGVDAPEQIRMERVVARSNISPGEVKLRMDRQMNNDEKMNLSDFVIVNDDVQPIIPQVLALHKKLLALAASK